MPVGGSDDVVVTGVGCAGPFGGREEFWRRLLAGDRAVRLLTEQDFRGVPCGDERRVAFVGAPAASGRIEGASGGGNPGAELPSFADPLLELLAAAADEAVVQAGLGPDSFAPSRAGCVIGTSKGGLFAFARLFAGSGEMRDWHAVPPHTGSTMLAGRFDFRGPCLAPVAACATGLVSVLRAAELIRGGACDVVLAGSGDASLHPAVLGSFRRMGVLAARFGEPAAACRPFNADREGFAVGEGAAVFVLERRRDATARGAVPLATVLGGALLSDPSGLTAVDPSGETLARAVADTLRCANLAPGEVGHVNLHGTATKFNDVAEAAGLRTAFGAAVEGTACVALKGAIGHQLGAAGAVELAGTVLAIRDGLLPPTVNLTDPDPVCCLPLAREVVRVGGPGVKVSLGFGGHVAVACLGPA